MRFEKCSRSSLRNRSLLIISSHVVTYSHLCFMAAGMSSSRVCINLWIPLIEMLPDSFLRSLLLIRKLLDWKRCFIGVWISAFRSSARRKNGSETQWCWWINFLQKNLEWKLHLSLESQMSFFFRWWGFPRPKIVRKILNFYLK